MRILHFSDVHLNPNEKGSATKLIGKLLRAITKDYGDNPAFDLVVFSGDLILSGGRDKKNNLLFEVKTGFEAFEEVVITPIREALHLPKERFVITIGNHDVDWDKAPKARQKEIKKLSTDTDIRTFYHKYICNDKAQWIRAFNSFRDAFYAGVPNYKSNGVYANLIVPISEQKVGISILDSAWGSLPGTKKVFFEREQLAESSEYLEDNECDYKICVMHNPVQCFCEDELISIQKLMLMNYDVCFTGHTHRQHDYKIEREQKNCYLSVAPKLRSTDWDTTEHNSRYKNGFVVYEDNGKVFAIDTFCYNEDVEQFEFQGRIETPKETPRNVQRIGALFEQKNVLRVDDFAFLRNAALDEIMGEIIGGKHQFIRLSALSGFGKTRLLYEIFNSQREKLASPSSNAYYCNTYPDDETVFKEVEAIVENNKTKQGVIILDNCNWKLIRRVIDYMSDQGTQMRLIGVDNNPYEGSEMDQCHSIFISPNIIKDEVDKHIDEALSQPIYFELKEDVKTLADGYPYMAYKLIEACRKKGSVSISNIDYLVRDMLRVRGVDEPEDNRIMLQAMALFQPMPTKKQNKEAFEFILNCPSITHLGDKDEFKRRQVFNDVLHRYSPILIDQASDWLIVRPYPLALWLIQQWFEVMDDECKLEKLATEIKGQSPDVAKLLTNNICRRISCMQESIPAMTLVEKLVQPGTGSFCSEKVVCSELGSRLFLAMATVNPEKVAKSLLYIFHDKSAEWIRANVTEEVRRNLVNALNKLCFAKESYADAVLVLAQFAEAENERWANNSTNSIIQLFPIQLPDTEVDLQHRATTLAQFWNMGYQGLALKSVNSAFKNGNFFRMGGAEKFGWRHRDPYYPKSNREVFDYWDRCEDLLLTWYHQDRSIEQSVCEIAEKHVGDWRSYGLMERYLFPIIEVVAPDKEWKWKRMYELLTQTLQFHGRKYTEEQQIRIKDYISRLTPTLFADTLVYTGRKIYDRNSGIKDVQERAHVLMEPLAKKFLSDEIYCNPAELKALLEIRGSEVFFMQELKQQMQNKQLEQFLHALWPFVEAKKSEFSSTIAFSILAAYKEEKSVQGFLNRILRRGYIRVYARALASMEDDQMHSYQQMLQLYKKGKLSYLHIEEYMLTLWGLTDEQMKIILPSLMATFPDKRESILDFIMRHRYWTEALGEATRPYVRELLLSCTWMNDNGFCIRDRISLVESYLQNIKEKDVDFAVQVNKKLIHLLGETNVHDDGLSELYTELLQEPYQDAIWNDFSKAFVENFRFYYKIHLSIGSGFSFGAGALFQYVAEDRLKEWCKTYGDSLSPKLAAMAPVFTYSGEKREKEFSDFLQWLIETYGEDKNVLSCISSNMGTMSWTGSMIPLYEDMLACIQPYLTHRYPLVQEWAQKQITYIQKEIDREQSQEDFMRMHYS